MANDGKDTRPSGKSTVVRDHLAAAGVFILHPFMTIAGMVISYNIFRLALRLTPFHYSSKVSAAGFGALLVGWYLWHSPGSWIRAFEVSLYPVLFPAVGCTLISLLPFPPGFKGGLLSVAALVLCLAGLGFQEFRARYRRPVQTPLPRGASRKQ